jgi:hypothetical protein
MTNTSLSYYQQLSLKRSHFKLNVHGTVHRQMRILYNQRDATYTMFFYCCTVHFDNT